LNERQLVRRVRLVDAVELDSQVVVTNTTVLALLGAERSKVEFALNITTSELALSFSHFNSTLVYDPGTLFALRFSSLRSSFCVPCSSLFNSSRPHHRFWGVARGQGEGRRRWERDWERRQHGPDRVGLRIGARRGAGRGGRRGRRARFHAAGTSPILRRRRPVHRQHHLLVRGPLTTS